MIKILSINSSEFNRRLKQCYRIASDVSRGRAISVALRLVLVITLVVSPAAPFVDSAEGATDDTPLDESAKHAISAYLSGSQEAYVPEPVIVDGTEYVVAYVLGDASNSRVVYSGNLGVPLYPDYLAYDKDWDERDLEQVLVFRLTDSGAELVPKDNADLIRSVVETQASLSWRKYDAGRPDFPITWVVEFQDGMLNDGVADVAFGWEKLTGFKSQEDRYLAALQAMTTTRPSKSESGVVPEAIEEEVTSKATAVQSADTAIAAANELASKNYVIVDGRIVDADMAETALRGYADDIRYISDKAGDAGFASSLAKLVLAISEEKVYSDKKVEMLTRIQEYSNSRDSASLDPALDGAITRLRNQHENTDQKTKQAIVTWLQEEGLSVGQYTVEKLAPKFGSWLVSNSQFASSASTWATSGASGTLLSGTSKAAGIVGVAKTGWDLGGVVGGRGPTYSRLKRAEFSRLAMQDFRQVRNDVRNQYGDDLSGPGEYARFEAASVYHASEFYTQRSLAEFYKQSYGTTQVTFFDDIVNSYEKVYNLLFGGNGIDNEQELMKEYASASMKKASKVRSTTVGKVLDRYPVTSENIAPKATLLVTPSATGTKKSVQFDATGGFDTDGRLVEYQWDFDGDNSVDETTTDPSITHAYESQGKKQATVTVVDDDGATDTAIQTVTVAQSLTSIAVDSPSWDIGQTLADGTREKAFTITNTGDVPTSLTVDTGSGVSVNGLSTDLSPGESTQFTAVMDADEYDGDPVVIRHDTGKTVIPVSVTIVSDDELVETEDSSMSDEYASCIFDADVFGDEISYCGQYGREWRDDNVEVDEDHHDGLDSASLEISFRPDSTGKEDNPLEIYLNGNQVATFESPAPESLAENDFVKRTVTVPLDYLEPGDNVVTMQTDGYSGYDIGDAELRYTYFEEPQLNLETKEFDDEVRVGGIVRIPVVIENNGGRPAKDIKLGISGETDDDAVDVVKWPADFDLDESGTVKLKEAKVRYFEVKLTKDRKATVEFAAISETDDDDITVTLRPPNDPPRLESRNVVPISSPIDEPVQYSAEVVDPDGDSVDLTLEVYDPSSGAWETVSSKTVESDEQALWSRSPFDAGDEGSDSKYRIKYDDRNGNNGMWGPFSGPALIDDDRSGPSISSVTYPDVVDEGNVATVNASISDASGVERAILWYQFDGGETYEIQMTQSNSRWTATIPAPPAYTSEISFAITAVDGDESRASSTSITEEISIESNTAPRADAGDNRTVEPGQTITLNATESIDPDGDSLSYSWMQLRGTPTELDSDSGPTATVTAPNVNSTTVLSFHLIVTDSAGDIDTDSVLVTIEPDTPDAVCTECGPPADLDGDGKYEDVNGNGVHGFGDVVTLFDNLRSDPVTEDATLYDYNNNGVVGFGDVIQLFEEI